MIEIRYNPADKRYIYMRGDVKEMTYLEKHLNKIPSYMFLPSYRGIPKPEVFLHKYKKDDKIIYWAHSGLWHEIYTYCSSVGIRVTGVWDDKEFKHTGFKESKEDFQKWVESLNLSITPRDYQIESAWKILKYRQSMSQLATRAGKTLIAYIVFRWMIEKENAKNILMIVPNISLVKQGVEDMSQYQEFFKSETVWAKSEYCESSNLTIGTFQSLVKRADKRDKKYNPDWFNKFDVVLCDECHKLPCKSINTILGLPFMKNVKLRFGFSGTIPESGSIENYSCQSMMGPVIQDISSRELIDEGYLADVKIFQKRIKYKEDEALTSQYIRLGEYINSSYATVNGKKVLLPKEERRFLVQHEKVLPYAFKIAKKTKSVDEYKEMLIDGCKANGSNLLLLEQMLMFESEKRMKVLEEILKSSDKNFIVFAHHTEYLKYMYEYFSKCLPDKHIYMIHGGTTGKKREQMRKEMNENDSCILFASYSCVGTGLTFKNVDYGVFAESFKSKIINKQSLGRGLLLAPGKDTFTIYDIIDCFPTKRIEWQGKAKEKLFREEGYSVEVEYID